MVAPMEFFAADVKRICHVKRNRLQTWLERGFIIPSIQKASGHGTRNIFSISDLYKIALFRHLIEKVKLSRERASDLISYTSYKSENNVYSYFDEPGRYNRILIFDSGEEGGESWRGESPINTIRELCSNPYFTEDGSDWSVIIMVNYGRIKKMIDKKIR